MVAGLELASVSCRHERPLELENELLEEFEHAAAVTSFLVAKIPRKPWRAKPPAGRGRTIAAIVAHIQSVQRTFARMGGARPAPPSLDHRTSTQAEARRALKRSQDALVRLFRGSLSAGEARVRGMPRRTVNMIAYLIQHDAHHRGQIFTLAADLGHRFSRDDVMKVWGWKKL